MRYVEGELEWEDLQGGVPLRVGQFLKFGAAVYSHSVGMNVVTALEDVAMVADVDSDLDVQLEMMENARVSGLVFGICHYWFFYERLTGAVQIARRRTVSEPAAPSASVPSSSIGGRSSEKTSMWGFAWGRQKSRNMASEGVRRIPTWGRK